MNSSSRQPASEEIAPAPGLLILTGASHTGKTSLAEAILRIIEPPAAFLSVDKTLATLARSPGDRWAQISLAYELLHPQVKTLLDEGWLVIFESTFTYVPTSDPPEFHADAMDSLIAIARHRDIPWGLVQIKAPAGEAARRVEESRRLPSEVVEKTIELHESAPLPSGAVLLDSTTATADELAPRALAALGG